MARIKAMKKSDRQKVFDKYCGRCAYCGCELTKGWHVDHLEPICRRINSPGCEKPERDNIGNMMPACASCNIQKHSMPLEAFRKTIARFVNSLNEYHTIYKFAKRYGLVQETGKEVTFYFELFNEKQ